MCAAYVGEASAILFTCVAICSNASEVRYRLASVVRDASGPRRLGQPIHTSRAKRQIEIDLVKQTEILGQVAINKREH